MNKGTLKRERKTTVLAEKRASMEQAKAIIMQKLDITEEEHFDFVVFCGLSFLNRIYPTTNKRYIELSCSKDYWTWFKLQFSNVETSFCNRMDKLKNVPMMMMKQMYAQDVVFFAVQSEAIQQAFKNYLKSK